MADDTKKPGQEISAGDHSENTNVAGNYTKHVHNYAPKESRIIKPTESDFMKYDSFYRDLMTNVKAHRKLRYSRSAKIQDDDHSWSWFSVFVGLIAVAIISYAVFQVLDDLEIIQEELVPVQN